MINITPYIGIPFENRGSSFNGCDCFGLIRLFYKEEFGILIPDPNVSALNAKGIFKEYLRESQDNWETTSKPENYAVVAVANDNRIPTTVNHVALVVGSKLLHSIQGIGSHIAPIQHYAWAIKGYHKWRM